MRKLTLVPWALLAASCASEDRCDPFLEADDCMRDGVRRYGDPAGQELSAPSRPGGPTAGPVMGPGPTAGPVHGGGPTAGGVQGSGPSAGPVSGPGPTAGSTNPAPLPVAQGALDCATDCARIYQPCARELGGVDQGDFSVGSLIHACSLLCQCSLTLAPQCAEVVFSVYQSCFGALSCQDYLNCLKVVGEQNEARVGQICAPAEACAAANDKKEFAAGN